MLGVPYKSDALRLYSIDGSKEKIAICSRDSLEEDLSPLELLVVLLCIRDANPAGLIVSCIVLELNTSGAEEQWRRIRFALGLPDDFIGVERRTLKIF